jgi:hypothetical protein
MVFTILLAKSKYSSLESLNAFTPILSIIVLGYTKIFLIEVLLWKALSPM